MGKYSVPSHIREMKPTGTVVKRLNGDKFYVYEQKHVKVDGKWKIQPGKMIGSIDPAIGFIPNDNYKKDDEITTVDFGEYYLAAALSEDTLSLLKEVFNVKDALNIYLLSLIHFVNGFTYIKNVKPLYDMSYLSIRYPSLSLSEYIVTKMLDDLGRRQTRVEAFENLLIERSSREMAVDGHAIKSSSHENSLSEDGYKKQLFKDRQINLLMAYDINTNRPVLSRMYDGSAVDQITFRDLFERKELNHILFIVDRGFYSAENVRLMSRNGNSYIVPIKANTTNYRDITANTVCSSSFLYERGKKRSVIEYKSMERNGQTVIFYRDMSQSAVESADYYAKIDGKSFTLEKYNEYKEFFGTIVLQTNLDKAPEEIYGLYKRRWLIETFYDYYKNRLDVNALHLPDYYQTQGLSFVMLVTSLIHHDFLMRTKSTGKNVTDLLLDARFLKLHKKKGTWSLENTSLKHYELFSSLNISLDDEVKAFNDVVRIPIN